MEHRIAQRARLALDSTHHKGSHGHILLALTELAGRPNTVIVNGMPVWSSSKALCASADGCAGGPQLLVGEDLVELRGIAARSIVLELEI